MYTSIFLLFVAAGISMASAVYGFGGLFPVMLGLSLIAMTAYFFNSYRSRASEKPVSA